MKKLIKQIHFFSLFILISFLSNSCEYNYNYSDVLLPTSEVKNEYGAFFLKQLQNQASAYEQFAALFSLGQEPLYEYVQIMSNADYGFYYFIPYGKIHENKVEGAIYFSLGTITEENKTIHLNTPLGTPIKINPFQLNNIEITKRFLYSIPFKDLKNRSLKVNPALVEFADKLEGKCISLPSKEVSPQNIIVRSSYTEKVDIVFEYQISANGTVEGSEVIISSLTPYKVVQIMEFVLKKHNIKLYEFGNISHGRINLSVFMDEIGDPGAFLYNFTEEVRREIYFLGYKTSFQYSFHVSYVPVNGGGSNEESSGGSTGGSSGTGGDSSSGGNTVTAAPLAKTIFRNSNMTEQNWIVLEKMLIKIKENCMGNALYNELEKVLNGQTLYIQFINSGNSAFSLDGGISLNIRAVSGDFFHEMLHAYQAYNESHVSMTEAKLNMEIETHYAQYLYQSNLPEYQTKNNKWKKRDTVKARWREIARLKKILDRKGNLLPGISNSKLESELLNRVIPTLQANGYPLSKYPVDYNRIGYINFKNLKELTKNC